MEAENTWKEKLDFASQPTNYSLQADWDYPLYKKQFSELLEQEEDPVERARLLAVESEHSGDWLNALPVASLVLKLNNNDIRIACGLRLGTTLCQEHLCHCGARVDKFGRHGLACKKSAGRHPKHSHINDLVKRALSSAGVPYTLESPGLSRQTSNIPTD